MGFFNLGGMTLSSVFKKKETLKYPFETKEPYEGQKGTIKNAKPEDCTLCGMCEKRCPCNAIKVERDKSTWSIQHFQCIQCGYCTRSCPKNCLVMDGHKPEVVATKEAEVIEIPKAEKKNDTPAKETKTEEKKEN